MPKYIFIWGKNPGLSMAEAVSCLKSMSVEFRIADSANDFSVVEAESLPNGFADRLGGTIKIGEVIFEEPARNFGKAMEGMKQGVDFSAMFRRLPQKSFFAVSSYGTGGNAAFSQFFKEIMRNEGISAGCIRPKKGFAVSHTDVARKRLVDKYIEFLVCSGRSLYVGRTIHVHNPMEFMKRDTGRPVQRPMLSIPPRLCRIMINLSNASDGILLDPFCGIGSILQEAVLMGFDIRGLDSDEGCVMGCIENMRWLGKTYGARISGLESRIRKGDARQMSGSIGSGSIDAVVTEPCLGPPLREKPGQSDARMIIRSVERLYRDAMREMLRVLKPGKRIVIVSPCFRGDGWEERLRVEAIASSLGARVVDPLADSWVQHGFPFTDSEERHRTIREISVVEKPQR